MPKLYLYPRGSRPTWYIGGYPTGKRQRTTRLAGPEKKRLAEKLLIAEQRLVDEAFAASGPLGPMTVQRWAPIWLAELRKNGEGSYTAYESIVNTHILPVIGRIELANVTADHVVDVLTRIRAGGAAQRTRRNCYRRLNQMLKRAVPKYLPVNPCAEVEAERPQVLPKNEDHDPAWRELAVFARDEVEALVFDERLPEDRRMLYGLVFLLGIRLSESTALECSAFNPRFSPLGKMLVARSWNTEEHRCKKLKTGVSRTVPVHDVLKELLHDWLAPGGGRERLVAMAPGKDEDLIVPSREGGHRNRHTVWAALQRDLETLGLRGRRVHDTRRTFISLIIDAGGHKDLLRFVTHGRPKTGDAFDQYKEPSWGPLCGEVMKLEIGRPAQVVPMRKYANLGDAHLQATYSGAIPEWESIVAAASSRFPCSGDDAGHSRTDEDRREHSAETADLADPDLGQCAANLPHFCQAVSESRKALTALRRGDIESAKAILAKLVGPARRAR